MPFITCISDTHNFHDKVFLPETDILIHAGDATGLGSLKEISSFLYWFSQQPAKHKILIAGNHDWLYENDFYLANSLLSQYSDITYLNDSMVEVLGVKIYGSPITPRFFDWAFNADHDELCDSWSKIPEGVDILVTHGPPHGILDLTDEGNMMGCPILAYEIVSRIKPKYHIFGHCHEGYGQKEEGGINYINASICNRKYKPVNKPITISL
jgi:Icc-related predicted phosphoesterase